MGADFAYATTEVVPRGAGHLAIDGIPKTELMEIASEQLPIYQGQNEWLDRDIDELREVLHHALDELDRERRDCGYLMVGDTTHWISGGMTWGDDPTDAFGHIVNLGPFTLNQRMATTPNHRGV